MGSQVGGPTVRYRQVGGRRPAPVREILEISNDGAFQMWRSVNAGKAAAPIVVGSFAGSLAPEAVRELAAELAGARSASNLNLTPAPDGPVEFIEFDGVHASLGRNQQAPGAWGPVIDRLRRLLGDLTRDPRAAIALEVTRDGVAGRLVHRGNQPVRVDLDALAVRAVLWDDLTKLGDWRSPTSARFGRLTVSPGWSLNLPLDHHFDVSGGRTVDVFASFLLYDGRDAIPVWLAHTS